MREFGRDLRIADFIRDELAAIIQREMRDPRVGMVSVNDARVSKDLSWADVYVSSFETQTEQDRVALIEVLNKASGYFRSELAKRHSMRTTPKIRFHYDEVVETGPKMEALIESAMAADRRAEKHRDG
ncbi:MAG: 30S ribosome-binding factor RbfA [Gammaproteobacteria bacterium]